MPRYKVRKRPLGLSKGSTGDIYVINRSGDVVRSFWKEFLEKERLEMERISIWQKIGKRLKKSLRQELVRILEG